jgi:hypothetical protein
MTAGAPDPTPPEARRFSIRLPRPLWVGLAAAAVVVAGIGLRIGIPVYRQRVAIREIERVGGYVTVRPPDLEWLPEWLYECMPERLEEWIEDGEPSNVFSTVDQIRHVGSGFTDDGMARIASLTEMRCLCLGTWNTNGRVHLDPYRFELLIPKYPRSDPAEFSDAGLVHLTGMRELETLDLNGTGITDAGMPHIGKLTGLRYLDLHATRVTDAGLRHLRTLVNLEWLDLRLTKVGDSGMDELHRLSKLKAIAVDATEVTGAGVEGLRRALPDVAIVW